MPSIVSVIVNQIIAPAPVALQQTGALISQGATSLAQGSTTLLTQKGDLTSKLAAALAIASLAWGGGTVVATTSAAIPGLTTGDTFVTSVVGAAPAAYNGQVTGTVTGANTFTYSLAVNPGAETTPGTYTPPGQGELQSMVNSYFAQGGSQGVYVLELGAGNGASGPTALGNYLTANPTIVQAPTPAGIYYSYLVPRNWDAQANFLNLIAQYEAPTAKLNFFVTTTTNTYQSYTDLMKNVFALVEAPGVPLTEFSCAAPFQASLSYSPSAANRMTPFSNKFLFGVTQYPQKGNNALLTTLYNANINYVGSAAEGGIAESKLVGGSMMDGNDFTYWFAADWAQINGQIVLANEVENGSNNTANPLYYDQNGVNRLQDRLVKLWQTGVSFGLLNGSVGRAALDATVFQQNFDDDAYVDENVVNAVPFIRYLTLNPSDYKAGRYAGLTNVIIPQRGFKSIVFNLTVSSLIAP